MSPSRPRLGNAPPPGGVARSKTKNGRLKMWIILVLVLALLLGGIGLAIKVVWWLLIIAGVLLLVGIIGALGRRRG